MYYESAALVGFAFNFYMAAMFFYYGFYIAKAKAKALYIMHIAGRYTVKGLEYFLLIFFAYAYAIIAYRYHKFVGGIAGRYIDARSLFAILKGIINQVINNIAQVHFIGKKRIALCLQAGGYFTLFALYLQV